MQYYALTALINALTSTACGLIVYLHNPHNRKNRSYFYHMAAVAIWSYFYVAWQLSKDATHALFFVRALMLAAGWISTFQYQQTMVEFDSETPFRKRCLWVLYANSIFLSLFSFSPYFVAGVEQRLQFPFWPIPGFLFHIHVISFVLPILISLLLVWEYRKKAAPLVQNQLTWYIVGIAFGYGGGGTNWPLWYNIPIPPIGNWTISVYVVISAFLFFKLGLVDIRVFFRDAFVYVLTCLILGGGFSLLLLPFFNDPRVFLSLILFSLAAPFLYKPLFKGVKEVLNQTWFGRQTQYLSGLGATVEKIKETTYTYDDLAQNIVRSLLNTFPIQSAGVYFYDLGKNELHLRAQQGMKNEMTRNLRYNRSGLAIAETNPIMTYINGKNDVLIREMLESGPENNARTKEVASALERIEAEVAAPFLFAGKVKGILVLGPKKNYQLFNKEDLDAVFSFARMGEEVMRYIMGMETELKHTALYSHDMAHDTRSLVQTLDFLQSPMAKKQPAEKLDVLLKQVTAVAVRLNQTFQLNRDRSTLIMKAIRGDYEKTSVDVYKLVRLSCGKVEMEAEKSQITLNIQFSGKSLMVLGNADDLIRVFDNIVGNAIRHGKSGGHVTLSAAEEDQTLQILIEDDGEGIDPADLEKIWEAGWQAQDAKKGSAGLGLSVVRQIISLHNGTIHAESRGKGHGSVFKIQLPLASSSPKP